MPLACFIVFFIANEWCSVISWLQPSYQLLNSNIFLLYALEVYICYFIVTCVLFARKVVFREDEIAYQIGETTEILSRSYLCATPHCVRVLSIIHFVFREDFGKFSPYHAYTVIKLTQNNVNLICLVRSYFVLKSTLDVDVIFVMSKFL